MPRRSRGTYCPGGMMHGNGNGGKRPPPDPPTVRSGTRPVRPEAKPGKPGAREVRTDPPATNIEGVIHQQQVISQRMGRLEASVEAVSLVVADVRHDVAQVKADVDYMKELLDWIADKLEPGTEGTPH